METCVETQTHTHTCVMHTQSPAFLPLILTAAVIAGAIVGILLLFILVGLLIFFLKRR